MLALYIESITHDQIRMNEKHEFLDNQQFRNATLSKSWINLIFQTLNLYLMCT